MGSEILNPCWADSQSAQSRFPQRSPSPLPYSRSFLPPSAPWAFSLPLHNCSCDLLRITVVVLDCNGDRFKCLNLGHWQDADILRRRRWSLVLTNPRIIIESSGPPTSNTHFQLVRNHSLPTERRETCYSNPSCRTAQRHSSGSYLTVVKSGLGKIAL